MKHSIYFHVEPLPSQTTATSDHCHFRSLLRQAISTPDRCYYTPWLLRQTTATSDHCSVMPFLYQTVVTIHHCCCVGLLHARPLLRQTISTPDRCYYTAWLLRQTTATSDHCSVRPYLRQTVVIIHHGCYVGLLHARPLLRRTALLSESHGLWGLMFLSVVNQWSVHNYSQVVIFEWLT